jgi:hypothetical protein
MGIVTVPTSQRLRADSWSSAGPRRWTPNEIVAVALGAVYLLAGVIAAAISLGATMAVSDGPGAGLGTGRTLSYLCLGFVLLAAAAQGRAKSANSVLGAAYLLAGVLLPLVGQPGCRLLTLNHPDCAIQLCTAALLLGFGRTQD